MNSLSNDQYNELKSLNNNLNPISIKYMGLGNSKVLCLNNTTKKYVLMDIGGSNGYDANDNQVNYTNYRKSNREYSLNEINNIINNLPDA